MAKLHKENIMPKVFTGKVVLKNEAISEYFKQLVQAEQNREPFKQYLCKLNSNFYNYLLKKLTHKTARKHSMIIEMFIKFLCSYTDVESLEEVTKGIANSSFRSWYKRKVWDSTSDTEIKTAVKKFFTYLNAEEGIINAAVINS